MSFNEINLNFVEIKLNNDKIQILSSNFVNKDNFKKLKEDYINNYFYRFWNKIYCWKINNKWFDNIPDFSDEEINIINNPAIFSTIIELSITNFLWKIDWYKIGNPSFLWNSILKDKNLLEWHIQWLEVKEKITISSFYFFKEDSSLIIWVTVSLKLDYYFNWNVNNFLSKWVNIDNYKNDWNQVYANKENVKQFLQFFNSEEKVNIKLKEYLDKNKYRSISYSKIESIFNYLLKYKNKLFLPSWLDFQELKLSNLYKDWNNINYDIITTPSYFFYRWKTWTWYYNKSLESLKPYSFDSLNNSKIWVLVPKDLEWTTEVFLKNLEKKLSTIFHLKVNYDIINVSDDSIKEYLDNFYILNSNKIDLIILILKESSKNLPIKISPYYVVKAKSIWQGIPTQDILDKTIKWNNDFTLNNLALNIYAKLWWIPWLIEKEDKIREEIIIWIWSTINDKKEQILWLANIFNQEWKFIVWWCSQLSNYNNYVDNLYNHLYSLLSSRIETLKLMWWKSEVRLIFHLFKSASKRYEIKAIEKLIWSWLLKNIDVSYCLVHLWYWHNFRLFCNKWSDFLQRWLYVNLWKNTSLLHLVKDSIVPLKINIDKRSTFVDIYYISKQLLWFSHLSYKSFIPSWKPVSIAYPNLIARLIEDLKNVDNWDYNILNTVKEKLWFI